MKKRLISIAVVLSIVASLFTFNIYSSAATSYVSPNMAILENILHGDRQFVIDTLIGTNYKTDFSTNPHALVNYIGDENTMMDNVLSQYRNEDDPNYKASYKIAVDIMEKVYNGDDYVQHATDWVTSFAADLLSIFSSDAQTVMDDLTYSVGELQYESILKEVLATDYTSSDGTTLSTKEIELENLERLDKGLKNLKDFASFFKADASANHMNDDTFDDRMDYYNKFLIPYTDSVESVLGSFADIQGTDDAEDLAAFITALAMVSQMDRFESANAEISSDITYYAPTFFIDDDTLGIVKSASSSISTISKTLSTYMFINSIGTQKEAVGDTLTRMSDNSKNAELNSILNTFANEVGEAGNAKLMGYESLMQYLRNAGAVNSFGEWAIDKVSGKVSPYVEKFICENLDMAWEYSNAGLAKTAASTILAKATNVAGISSWCADKAMSFGDTCKKTYELKYLEKIIKVAVDTYNKDVQTYLSNKTEENAENVLDDLLMIQKLRLRGETVAYKMTYGQWNSPLGRLLANGTLNKDETLISALDDAYQYRVDAIIGASAMPFTSDSLTVNNGESLTIDYSDAKGGLYGEIISNNRLRGIGELKYKVSSGITVNSGGTVLMRMEGNPNAYIPYITNNGGTVIFGGNTNISEYTQNSGTTALGANTSYINSLHLNGGTLKSVQRDTLSCKYLDNSGGTATLEIPIYCENLSVKGKINGSTVYLKGDSEGGGGIIQNLCLNGTISQTLRNITCVENLTYNNQKGITQEGTVKISGTLKNINTKLKNAKNTILTDGAKIDGGYYKQDITISGKISEDFVEYGSNVFLSGSATVGSMKVNNMIYQSSGSFVANGDIEIKGTANFKGSVCINGDAEFTDSVTFSNSAPVISGKIVLKNDATFPNSTNLNQLVLSGTNSQRISGVITVNDYTNNNTNELTINNKIYVKGKAKSSKAPVSGASNVTLIDNSGFAESKYYGDITIGNRSGSIPDLAKVYGSIYINGNITQTETDTILYAINMNGGSLVVKDCTLSLKNRFTLNSGTIALQNAKVICSAVFNPSSTVTIDENSTLEIYSDLANKGTMSGEGTVKVSGNITNSGTLKVRKLILSAEMDRNVSGNAIDVKEFQAIGSKAIDLSTTINVSEKLDLGNAQMDASKVKYITGMEITSDSTIKDNLFLNNAFNITNARVTLKGNISVENNNITLAEADLKTDKNITITNGNLIVGENSKVTCSGKLSITNGNITVYDNSTLMVRKNADLSKVNINLGNNSKIVFYSSFNISGSSSNSITIDDTSSLISKNLMNVNILGSIEANGELILGGDAILKSTVLSGSGTATLYGDLSTTSTTNLLVGDFKISGKFAQRIKGSSLNFNNLTINNNSSAGVTFDTATYKGELVTGSSIVNGSLTAVE